MKVRPLHDKVLIQILDTEETTKGGIIIPDTAKEKPQEGKVIAVGTGRILEDGTKKPLDIKKGEKVLFNKYGGIDISIDGEDYLILREEDILAVVD
jgi:chaperonin GroES